MADGGTINFHGSILRLNEEDYKYWMGLSDDIREDNLQAIFNSEDHKRDKLQPWFQARGWCVDKPDETKDEWRLFTVADASVVSASPEGQARVRRAIERMEANLKKQGLS